MKRKGNLYDQMCDKRLIIEAIENASHGKRHHSHVRRILCQKDKYAEKILRMLQEESFEPSSYIPATIKEGSGKKQREISKPRFYPDQVIHWCIYLVLKPWLFRRFYALNMGSIPGRGVHEGKRHIEKWVRNDRKNTKYYLKMDVRKFYPSIKTDYLMVKLRRIIKDERFLRLNEKILRMNDGLPIGMLLSQVYANFFLTETDFYIKQQLGAKYYLRYMDDMVIFGPNKKELHRMRKEIEANIGKIGLRLKGNWQVCRFDKEPLDFMGFRFYRDRTTIRRSIMLRLTEHVRRSDRDKCSYHLAAGVLSYLGWLSCTDSHTLYEKRIMPYLHVQRLKNIIRRRDYEILQSRIHRHAGSVGQNVLPGEGVSPHQYCPGDPRGRGAEPYHRLPVRRNRVYEQGVYRPDGRPAQ